jgi:hypothetical protein
LETTPVSESIKRIVKFIDEHKRATRKDLIDTLAPSALQTPPAPESETGGQESVPAAFPPEVTAIITDLHWLVHEGHGIEFATGTLETAKKPAPRPAKTREPKVKAEVQANSNKDPAQVATAAASPVGEVEDKPANAQSTPDQKSDSTLPPSTMAAPSSTAEEQEVPAAASLPLVADNNVEVKPGMDSPEADSEKEEDKAGTGSAEKQDSSGTS